MFGLLLPLKSAHKKKEGRAPLSAFLNFSGSSLCKTFHESSQPFPTSRLLESSHSCYGSRYGPCPKEEREGKQPDHPGLCKPGVTDTFLCGPHLSEKIPQTQFVKHIPSLHFSPHPLFFTPVSCSSLELGYLCCIEKDIPEHP